MFKRNFPKFLNKPLEKPELYPYLYAINFKGLEERIKKELDIAPIQCSKCGAILTDIDQIKEDSKIGTYFNCKYCGTLNTVEKTTLIERLPDEIEFILRDVQKKVEEKIEAMEHTEGELYIAVIDISGSMSSGKIEAVKKSLVQTLKDFKLNSPSTKFLLIAFESSVYYYLKHDRDAIKFSGDALFSIEGMRKLYEQSVKDLSVGSIGEFADGWIKKIQNLRTIDMTALGPALFFAILSFEKLGLTGRITLLTDGLANQGIGNLSGTSPGAEQYYEKMAELCNQLNIIVDFVGVSSPGDNNEMGLQTLGKITDKTGGNMYLISSDKVEAIFSELRQKEYLGKDVAVRIITPPNVKVKNISGAYSSRNQVQESEINLGAVTRDRELYVELDLSSEEIKEIQKEAIPMQLQVEYLDKDGRKRLRVLNEEVPITSSEKEFKANYDQKVNAMMNIQMAGTEIFSGKADKSRRRLDELKKNIENEMLNLKGAGMTFAEEDYAEGIAFLDDELEEISKEEREMEHAPAKSYMAAQGQSRARMSQALKKEKIAKKKKEP